MNKTIVVPGGAGFVGSNLVSWVSANRSMLEAIQAGGFAGARNGAPL